MLWKPPMIYYRLRPGAGLPAFRQGELYRFLRNDSVPGYIFIVREGKARCVEARHFEPVEPGDNDTPPAPSPDSS